MIDRRRFALVAGVLALARFAPTAAQEATPASLDDLDASIVGLASRSFRAPDPDAPGLRSLDAMATAFGSPAAAAAAFPLLFDVVAFGMLDNGGDAVDAPAPAVGDEAGARTLRVGEDGGDVTRELAAVGFRAGSFVVVVTAMSDGGSPLDDAARTVENAWRRAVAAPATPEPGAWGRFVLLPTSADVPPGLDLEDEDAILFDD